MQKRWQLKNYQKGITLIEIIVVIFIITLFASIAFLNLPKIQGSFALSSAAYELAQNIRTAENMSTSGLKTDSSGNATAGFGIFIDLSSANRLTKNYKMYADNCPVGNPDQLYSASGGCTDDSSIIGVDKNNAGISMTVDSANLDGTPQNVSINFLSPNPKINIDGMSNNFSEIHIVLSLDSDPSQKKTVIVNTSGLIEVQ